MQIAIQTKQAIDRALEYDGGASFRRHLQEAMKDIGDAFAPEEELHPREHLGASLIGRSCDRYLWLSWRWAFWKKPMARMIRLFNRGHLEEARWIALLRQAGMHTQHLHDGKQLKIYGVHGHYGGSLDGLVFGCPDVPGVWGLLEFKTSNKNTFQKLVKQGVQSAKPEHYTQCQQYMAHYGLSFALYGCVCKDDDEIHLEIILPDATNVKLGLARATVIVGATKIPAPMQGASSLSFDCKFCDAYNLCHSGVKVLKTCRSCENVVVGDEGKWICGHTEKELTATEQFAACDNYLLSRMFL